MFKISIFTAEDYDFLFGAWCDFVERSAGKCQIAGIFVFPDTLKNKKGVEIYFEYLKIFGFFDFLMFGIKTLWRRLNKKKKKYSSFRDLAKKNKIPYFYKDNPNSPEVVELVKENQIDVILISFGYIVKAPLIEAAKVILNKHSALLPAYRGLWPIFWALNSENNVHVGATIHTVTREIDKGEIILQKDYGVLKSKSVFEIYGMIYEDMADLFFRALDNLKTGKREIAEEKYPASYFSLPGRNDYKNFKNKGLKFI